jgi:D-alanyl-D-alanine dipeptidase
MLNKLFILLFFLYAFTAQASNLPNRFVYLKDIDPSIIQDIRYAGYHNFIGRPIKGYEANECILTKKAALALRDVQTELKKSDLSIKVYDCYRPQMAVNDFVEWSKIISQQNMKPEFYPHINKSDFFKLGYVAEKSSHTRGSTIDLTIVSVPIRQQADYHRGQSLVACFLPYKIRYQDNSIDMGTGFDCFDPSAHGDNRGINLIAFQHRQLLRALMEKYQFVSYPQEWWHFTLKDEPYPNTYFNFLIVSSV